MPVLFALGFRPFFLLSGLFAILSIALWVPTFVGWLPLNSYYGQIGWHSHEMIFGYTAAVIAGFLLTAVRNWTGMATAQGWSLVALTLIWCLARILPFFPSALSAELIALVDLSFLPALAVGIGVPLVRRGDRRNLLFLPLIAVFWLANLLVHLALLGFAPNLAHQAVLLGLDLVVLLIVIMGGRVIPFFTKGALPGMLIKSWSAIEWLAISSVIAFTLAEFLLIDPRIAGLFAGVAAIANGIRLGGWYTHRLWRVPLLWVLHLGYSWIVVGFMLKAGSVLAVIPPQFTLHAFSLGAIGVLTLGMMARVSLGHTGRPLKVGPGMASAFAAVNLAAVTRGLLPILYPQWFSQLVILSGGLWLIAYAIFIVVYVPILLQPRLDGKSG
ncbi:MAG: NnrS family protein [Candidatus Binatia bacterium]